MAWLAEAHSEWHTVNGWNEVCPLDCGVGEPEYEPTEEEIAEAEAWLATQPEREPTDPWEAGFEPPF